MPKVSIIITSYNLHDYIAEAIASAAIQSERDIEIIVVDDGSNDGTLEAIRKEAATDGRIRVCPLRHEGKVSIARNAGIALARSEYVCFLDGDDLYHPSKVEQEVKFLDANPDVDVVFHDLNMIDKAGSVTSPSLLRKHGFPQQASSYLRKVSSDTYICSRTFYIYMSLGHSSVSTPTIMIRRSLLVRESLRFAEDIKIGQDLDFWWRVVKGRQVGYIDRQLASYRIHGTNTTKNTEKLHRDSLVIHERNFARCVDALTPEQRGQYTRKIANIWFCLGYFCATQQRITEARQHYVKAFSLSAERRFAVAYLKTFLPRILAHRGAASGSHQEAM